MFIDSAQAPSRLNTLVSGCVWVSVSVWVYMSEGERKIQIIRVSLCLSVSVGLCAIVGSYGIGVVYY